MKIIDVKGRLNEEIIRKEIEDNLKLLEDLVHVESDLRDDYRTYRMLKSIEKIEMYLRQVEITIKNKK